MRWTPFACGLVLSVAAIRSAPAVDFPGPAPGEARGRLENQHLVLENEVLRADWDIWNNRLRLVSFQDKVSGTAVRTSDSEAVSIRLGPSGARPELRVAGQPKLERVAVRPYALRLAEGAAGWKATVPLACADGKITLSWQAVLRDQANYVHVEAVLEDASDASIEMLILLDMPVPDAKAGGEVDGSPVVTPAMFFACEHPMAANRVENARVLCSVGTFFPKTGRLPLPLERSAVLGVAPAGQMRRAFLYYLEHQRARPYAPFLHYNSWYDIAWREHDMDEALCREAVEVLGRELVEKRGGRIDSFVFDDGWDDSRTLWKFHGGFPHGFAPVTEAARKYQSTIGVWLSPWGGYGDAKTQRMEYGKKEGFEVNAKGFSLAGPRYFARFRDACAGMVRDYGVNYFKFDGIAQGISSTGAGPDFAGDVEALLRLNGELRRLRPDLFINITTGTWPSPFWLWSGDSIWRNGHDMGLTGEGSLRQQWINYRDAITWQWIVRRAPFYPINSLMTQGICHSQYGAASKFDTDLKDFRDEVRSFFASGTQCQELYIRPQMLTTGMWEILAEGAAWSRKNQDVLADVHWIGGDPAKPEVYGWAAWSPRQGMLALRNPSSQPARISLDLKTAFELPAGVPARYRLQSPWKDDAGPAALELSAAQAHTFELPPFEVNVFDAVPVR